MHHLLLAAMAIALMGYVVAAQVQHINPLSMLSAAMKKSLVNDLENIEQGFVTYRKANTVFVTTAVEGEVGTTETTSVLFTKPRGLFDLIGYVTPPSAPAGTEWSLGLAGGGVYLCLDGDFPLPLAIAVTELDAANYAGAYAGGGVFSKFNYHNACGAVVSTEPDSNQMALTYWLMAPAMPESPPPQGPTS